MAPGLCHTLRLSTRECGILQLCAPFLLIVTFIHLYPNINAGNVTDLQRSTVVAPDLPGRIQQQQAGGSVKPYHKITPAHHVPNAIDLYWPSFYLCGVFFGFDLIYCF
ncbi:hypothetical protein O7N79_003251 [Salmonella enterica]|nr:hypothetical protein [Salmonella enterica]